MLPDGQINAILPWDRYDFELCTKDAIECKNTLRCRQTKRILPWTSLWRPGFFHEEPHTRRDTQIHFEWNWKKNIWKGWERANWFLSFHIGSKKMVRRMSPSPLCFASLTRKFGKTRSCLRSCGSNKTRRLRVQHCIRTSFLSKIKQTFGKRNEFSNT